MKKLEDILIFSQLMQEADRTVVHFFMKQQKTTFIQDTYIYT